MLLGTVRAWKPDCGHTVRMSGEGEEGERALAIHRIVSLLAELRAIEAWDRSFATEREHNEGDRFGFESRRGRRLEIAGELLVRCAFLNPHFTEVGTGWARS
jgi:hypothetical protein